MPTDDRTVYFDMPKPAASNRLEDDVLRLREFADDVDLALNLRPLASTVTSQINSAVSGLATSSALSSGLAGKVGTARTVSAGTGLTGGGALSGDISLALTTAVIASLALADAATPSARVIYTGAGLSGGGDLTANRTISPTWASQVQAEAGVSQVVILNPLGGAQLVAALRPWASQAEAEAGASQVVTLSPLRGAQLVAALRPWASQAQAEAGSSATTAMTPQRTAQQIAASRPWASQAQAEAGTDTATAMTPQRVAQAIAELTPAPDLTQTIRAAGTSGDFAAGDIGNIVGFGDTASLRIPSGFMSAGQRMTIISTSALQAGPNVRLQSGVSVKSARLYIAAGNFIGAAPGVTYTSATPWDLAPFAAGDLICTASNTYYWTGIPAGNSSGG